MPANRKFLWEILVPTMITRDGRTKPVRKRYHKVWDKKIHGISGGLTVFPPAVGMWTSPSEQFFSERMIPVRIMCTCKQIDEIVELTAGYYNQEAVMYYRLSDVVHVRNFKPKLTAASTP